MVDSLDMHAILGDGAGFRQAVATVLHDFESGALSFDRDVVVSVFEASIRVLGGLVSGSTSCRVDGMFWFQGGQTKCQMCLVTSCERRMEGMETL